MTRSKAVCKLASIAVLFATSNCKPKQESEVKDLQGKYEWTNKVYNSSNAKLFIQQLPTQAASGQPSNAAEPARFRFQLCPIDDRAMARAPGTPDVLLGECINPFKDKNGQEAVVVEMAEAKKRFEQIAAQKVAAEGATTGSTTAEKALMIGGAVALIGIGAVGGAIGGAGVVMIFTLTTGTSAQLAAGAVMGAFFMGAVVADPLIHQPGMTPDAQAAAKAVSDAKLAQFMEKMNCATSQANCRAQELSETLDELANAFGFTVAQPNAHDGAIADARTQADGSQYRLCCVCDATDQGGQKAKWLSVVPNGVSEAQSVCQQKSGTPVMGMTSGINWTRQACRQMFVAGGTCGQKGEPTVYIAEGETTNIPATWNPYPVAR
jgi:hypothetical protein